VAPQLSGGWQHYYSIKAKQGYSANAYGANLVIFLLQLFTFSVNTITIYY
jgi:hypothetical protein